MSQKKRWWKKEVTKNTALLESESEGALCGEGVSFFVLSSEKQSSSLAELKALKMIYKPEDNDRLLSELNQLLQENKLNTDDIDLVVTGHNGDYTSDALYYEFLNTVFPETAVRHISSI
jgi:3-oxoacyl-[acyl-carrier-protein] synthase II